MSKKTQLAEMMRRKNALEAQLKALKESKKVAESQGNTGLAFLIEATLEKAEVVMAAKSVVEKLQKMAEDLAKVNGDEIMPIMEPLKAAFGPQMADAFQAMVSEKINATVMAVTQAKDAISSEVAKFEGIIDGSSPGNDMADMGVDAAAPAAPSALPGDAADLGAIPGADPAVSAGPAADMSVAGDAAVPGDEMDDIDASFDADTASAAGRAKKESVALRGKALSESEAKILKAFRGAIREGAKPVPAAKTIARHFGIDYADVVEIVRESGLGK